MCSRLELPLANQPGPTSPNRMRSALLDRRTSSSSDATSNLLSSLTRVSRACLQATNYFALRTCIIMPVRLAVARCPLNDRWTPLEVWARLSPNKPNRKTISLWRPQPHKGCTTTSTGRKSLTSSLNLLLRS